MMCVRRTKRYSTEFDTRRTGTSIRQKEGESREKHVDAASGGRFFSFATGQTLLFSRPSERQRTRVSVLLRGKLYTCTRTFSFLFALGTELVGSLVPPGTGSFGRRTEERYFGGASLFPSSVLLSDLFCVLPRPPVGRETSSRALFKLLRESSDFISCVSRRTIFLTTSSRIDFIFILTIRRKKITKL